MREQFVDVEGGRIWCGVTGKGPRPPLVCVHGGPGSTHDSYVVLSDLGDRPYVFYDQLGSGKSDRPDDDSLWTLERFVGEIDDIRKALGLDEFHLFGGSWGGAVAAAYAARRPPGLRSLILSSPLISVDVWTRDALRLRGELPDEVKEMLERHERSGHTECPEYVAASLVFYKRHVCRLDPWPEEVEVMFGRVNREIYMKMWGPSEFNPTGTLVGMDLRPRLSLIEIPTLFICGRYDEATPESVTAFAAQMKDARVRVLQNSSHLGIFEEREAFLSTIRDFLSEVDPGQRRSVLPSS